MRDADNIRDVSALDIDLMGFIFFPKSSRYVPMTNSGAGIIPDYADENHKRGIKEYQILDKPKRVGVFVDDMPQNIVTRVYNYHLDYVQLHGNENRVMIENLKRTLVPDISPNIKIIKAISISCADDIKRCDEYDGLVDLLLFDTKCPTSGGSGVKFDWNILQAYKGNTPFLLSGGIGPDDAEDICKITHPRFAGIDLNSRFESAPAMKDVEKLSKFISKIRQYEQNQ